MMKPLVAGGMARLSKEGKAVGLLALYLLSAFAFPFSTSFNNSGLKFAILFKNRSAGKLCPELIKHIRQIQSPPKDVKMLFRIGAGGYGQNKCENMIEWEALNFRDF